MPILRHSARLRPGHGCPTLRRRVQHRSMCRRSTCRRLTRRAPAEARRAPSCPAAAIPWRLRMKTCATAVSSGRRLVSIPTRARVRRLVRDGAPAASPRGFLKLSRRTQQHPGNPRPIARRRVPADAPIHQARVRRPRRHRRRPLRRDLPASHRQARRRPALHRHPPQARAVAEALVRQLEPPRLAAAAAVNSE
jgi:hypothetical protein